jgi:hypothetical protein
MGVIDDHPTQVGWVKPVIQGQSLVGILTHQGKSPLWFDPIIQNMMDGPSQVGLHWLKLGNVGSQCSLELSHSPKSLVLEA